jgi:hypothetical protein
VRQKLDAEEEAKRQAKEEKDKKKALKENEKLLKENKTALKKTKREPEVDSPATKPKVRPKD